MNSQLVKRVPFEIRHCVVFAWRVTLKYDLLNKWTSVWAVDTAIRQAKETFREGGSEGGRGGGRGRGAFCTCTAGADVFSF